MTGFSAHWLALREPADLRARNTDLLAAVASHFRPHFQVRVIDLACGRGSTLRAVSPLLPERQHWTLVDEDKALLDDVACIVTEATVETRRANLQLELEAVLNGTADLVTSSAFLDLVSADWLQRLAKSALARRLPVYAALSYDGRMNCIPRHELDDEVLATLNRHQQRDKGLGVALGPSAAIHAARIFRDCGFAVQEGPSDWRLRPDEQELQRQLVAGWYEAAADMGDIENARLASWRDHRLAWIARGESEIVVGHSDLWAVPPAEKL